jgi:2-iminobutanoate/2-iminopropanoate deaminase
MPEVVKVSTGSKFEEIGSYSRLVAVDNLIFVSLTAGRNPRTKEIPQDLTEQTRQVLANVETALAAVGASLEDVVSSRVFVQDPQDIDVAMATVAERFRGINPALTLTSPRLGSPQYQIEMEVIAYRGVSGSQVRQIKLNP